MKSSASALVAVALVVVLCLGFGINSANGLAIIGIDLGTHYMKVGVVRPGRSFEIVLNEATKRKSETMVSMMEGERLYGTNAFGMYSRKPKAAFIRLRELIGRNSDHPALSTLEKHGYVYDVVADEETGGFRINFEEDSSDDSQSLFRVQELIAMILQYARKISEDYSETNVKDAVITVPSYFNQFEREALLDAADIAGLNVLSLIDENAAAALQFGVYKEFPNTTSTYLVYNMGAASTQVSVVDFWGKPVKNSKNLTSLAVRSKAWDETLGGYELDRAVVNYLADKFDEQNKITDPKKSIRAFPRPMARILKEAIKIKEVLSANEEIPVSIQSLHNDIDLFTSISRSQLENMCAEMFTKVTKPIDEALEKAGITKDDLDAVEVIGGSTRVPKVKEILKEYFSQIKDESGEPMELGAHLNGDEAMALGAVFMGANLSKGFRVRSVGFSDVTTFAVGVNLQDLETEEESDWNKNALLFKANNTLNSRKVVTFQHVKDISCTLKDENTNTAFAQYDVQGIVAANDKHGHLGKPKVSLTFLLSLNGTAELVKAEATFVEKIEPPPEDNDDVENATETDAQKEDVEKEADEEEKKPESDSDSSEDAETNAESESESDTGAEAEAEAEASTEENKDEKNSEEKSESTDSDSSNSTKEEKKPKKKKGPTKKTHRFPLTIERLDKGVSLKGLTGAAKAEGRELLKKWNEIEAAKAEHEGEKNALESFVFACRGKLRDNEEDVAKVASEEEVEKLFEDLEEVEDWLYEDEGENADVSVYKSKKKALSKRVDKIMNKIKEMVQLPLTVKAAKELVEKVHVQIGNWTVDRPWVSKDEIEALKKAVDSFADWLKESEEAQKELEESADSVLTSSLIVQKLEPIQFRVEQILKRKMPVPKKPKVNKTKVEEESKTSESEEKEKGEEKDAEEAKEADADTEESEEKHDEL